MQIEPCPRCNGKMELDTFVGQYLCSNDCTYSFENDLRYIRDHNELSIKVQRAEQYRHFAELAKPIVDHAKALFGGLTEDEEGVQQCTACLAEYPEKQPKPAEFVEKGESE